MNIIKKTSWSEEVKDNKINRITTQLVFWSDFFDGINFFDQKSQQNWIKCPYFPKMFMLDILPDTTLYFKLAGNRHREIQLESPCGYIDSSVKGLSQAPTLDEAHFAQ